jgi:type IV secretory pathway TraG/TraD family ATPase VirD4
MMDIRLPNHSAQFNARWPLLVITVVLVLFSLSQAFFVVRETTQVLSALGWENVKGVGPFPVRCTANAACSEQFNVVLGERTTVLWRQVLFGFCFASLIASVFVRQTLPKASYGNAHFATAKELAQHERTAVTAENYARGHLGYWPNGKQIRYNDKLHRTHTLVVGKSGSGKTSRVFIPNILQDIEDGNSVIVFDSKFPDKREGLTKIIPDALKAGYEVYALFPFQEHTMHYELIPQGLTWLEAERRAFFFFPVDDGNKGTEYYTNNERILLKTLFSAYSNFNARSPKGLFDIITGPETKLRDLLVNQSNSRYLDRMGLFLSLTTMQQQSFLTGLVQGLTVFDNEFVSKAHTRSPYASFNIDVRSLGCKPKLLIVGIPESTLKAGLGQLYLRMLYRFLVDGDLIPEAEAQGGRLAVPVTLYLDEFNNLGYLAGIMSQQATLRAKNISLVLGVQNRSMNEAIYGKETAEAITDGNTATIITFPSSLSPQDREWLSEQGGSYTAIDESESKRFQGLSFFRSGWGTSRKQVEKRLFTTDDLKHFPDDMALIRVEGLPMIKSIMPRYFDKRVRRIRNKFASSLASHTPLFDPVSWSILYLGEKRRQDEAAKKPEAPEEKIQATEPQPSPPQQAKQVRRKPVATPHDDERDANDKLNLLKKLLDLVLERHVSYELKRSGEGIKSLVLAWDAMPKDILKEHHNRINEGLKRSLITVRKDSLRFTPAALTLIPEPYQTRLISHTDAKGKAPALTPTTLPYSATFNANLISGESVTIFRRWLESLPQEAHNQVTIIEGSIWFSENEVKTHSLDIKNATPQSHARTKGYELPLPVIVQEDALYQHVEKHLERLTNHPICKTPSHDMVLSRTTLTVQSELMPSFKRHFTFKDDATFVLLEV